MNVTDEDERSRWTGLDELDEFTLGAFVFGQILVEIVEVQPGWRRRGDRMRMMIRLIVKQSNKSIQK